MEAIKQKVLERTRGFWPDSSDIARFAGEVCGAFGQGYSYEQVFAATEAAGRYRFLGVSSSEVQYGIRHAVRLHCPGHKDRLP